MLLGIRLKAFDFAIRPVAEPGDHNENEHCTGRKPTGTKAHVIRHKSLSLSYPRAISTSPSWSGRRPPSNSGLMKAEPTSRNLAVLSSWIRSRLDQIGLPYYHRRRTASNEDKMVIWTHAMADQSDHPP